MNKNSPHKMRLVGLLVGLVLVLAFSLGLSILTSCDAQNKSYIVMCYVSANLDGVPWTGPLKYTVNEESTGKTTSYSAVRRPFLVENYVANRDNENSFDIGTYYWNITYISGGPPGALFLNTSFDGGYDNKVISKDTVALIYLPLRAQYNGVHNLDMNAYVTFNFVTTGTVNVNATLNGQPWSGQMDYTVSGANTTAGKSVEASFKYMKPGDYQIVYKSGGPEGGILKSITPAKAGLTVGQSVNYTLNFVTNSLNIVATLDGKPWSGPCEFAVNPPRGSQTDQPGVIDSQAGQVQIISSTGESTSYNGTAVPAVFEHTPNGVYRLAYVSGGPPGRIESITPEYVQLLNGQSGTLTLNFSSKGVINIQVFVDGFPYSGTAAFEVSGLEKGSTDVVAKNFNVPYSSPQISRNYAIRYPATLPNGAIFTAYTISTPLTPANMTSPVLPGINTILGNLDPGGVLSCTVSYTNVGSITVSGTKNGEPWSGPCEFTLTALDYARVGGGRVTFAGHTLPATFADMQKGRYEVTYVSGGPEDAAYSKTSPSSILQVSAGGNSAAVMEFVSGSITVTASMYGSPWSGVCSYRITRDTPKGPISFTGTEVPFTFSSLPVGRYTITYLSGGPEGYLYNGIYPLETQEISDAKKDIGFNIRFAMLQVLVINPPVASADLSLTLVPDTISITQSTGVVIFTITVTNSGPQTATGVEVTFLPNGGGWVAGGAGVYNTVTGVWTVGDLNSGASRTLTITVVAGIITGPYTNTAEVTLSGTFDPDSTPNNNVGGEDDQATVIITVTP